MSKVIRPDSERGQLPAPPEASFSYAPGLGSYYGEEVDLRDIWSVIRRRRITIFGTLVAVLIAVGAYTWLVTPVWQASTLIRVDEGDRSNVAAHRGSRSGGAEESDSNHTPSRWEAGLRPRSELKTRRS